MMLRLGYSAVVLATLCGAMWPSFSASAGRAREFSAQERQQLQAGELVQRPASQRRGDLELTGGASWQVIDASPEVVWQALLDTQHYPRMMPRVLEARVVGSSGRGRTVFMRQGAEGWVEKRYFLKVRVDEQRRDITFTIDDQRPHDLRAAWGFYTVRPYGQGQTLLAYGVMADLGGGVLESLVRDSVQEWMLKTPWMIKRFVEGSGRYIYSG